MRKRHEELPWKHLLSKPPAETLGNQNSKPQGKIWDVLSRCLDNGTIQEKSENP